MNSIEEQNEKFLELDKLFERYDNDKGQLIRILQGAQEIFGYLPEEVQTYIAGKMGIPVSEISGVVTFYSLFTTEPRGKFTINVCTGTACYVQGAQGILDQLKSSLDLGDKETTTDKLFTVKSTRCVGACGLAPVLTINDDVHGKVTKKDVPRLLRSCKSLMEVKPVDKIPEGFREYQEQAPTGH